MHLFVLRPLVIGAHQKQFLFFRAVRSQLSMIANICRDEGVACVMNGDVKDRDEALQLIKEFDVDGAMIGSAAEANPSV